MNLKPPAAMRPLQLPSLLSLGLVAALALGASACDSYDDDDDGPGYGVAVVDFDLDGDDFELSADGQVASFASDDIASDRARDDVREVLRNAGSGALVMLYADNSLILEGTEGSYTALPVTVGQEILVVGEEGQDDVTTLAVTYSYSFDDADLYFDVLSSTPLAASGDDVISFDDFLPNRIDLRLVTVPADLYYGKAGARVDLRDYEAVKQAFNLPD